jgi:ferredoxin
VAERVRVSLSSGESFDVSRDENLLAAAQRAHWLIRFGCRNGNCEACAATLLSGCVEQRGTIISTGIISTGTISADTIAADTAPQSILLCLAHAQSDLQIQLPSNPLHGSAEHARRVYAQFIGAEQDADRRWQMQFLLPAGRQLPRYAGQMVRLESEPAVAAFIETIAADGRELIVVAEHEPKLNPGERVGMTYPLGYAYRVADSLRPLWLLCETSTRVRALQLQSLWPGSVVIDCERAQEWPVVSAPPIVHAYATTATTVQGWYQTLLAKRMTFVELRSDFSILRPWRVCRLDDNDNRFVMAEFLDEPAARALVDEFSARGHKQLYWAEPGAD